MRPGALICLLGESMFKLAHREDWIRVRDIRPSENQWVEVEFQSHSPDQGNAYTTFAVVVDASLQGQSIDRILSEARRNLRDRFQRLAWILENEDWQ